MRYVRGKEKVRVFDWLMACDVSLVFPIYIITRNGAQVMIAELISVASYQVTHLRQTY